MANYSKKDIILVVVRNILFILLIVLLFQYVYKKVDNNLQEKIELKEKYEVIYSDLENFSELVENMSETKNKMDDIIGTISGEYVPNQVLITSYRDRVFSIAEEYSIKVTTENFVRDEATGMVTLEIGFNSKYETIYKFLFAIEMFSKVNSFSINENMDVMIKTSPILYNNEVDGFFSGRTEKIDELRTAGYFKEIFQKSAEAVNDMGHIPTWRDIVPAPEDPFYEYIPPKKKKAPETTQKVVRKLPTINISGIIFDETNPIVIIDGKLYRQGDFYKTVKILTIRERTITVELDGQKYIVKFNKEG